ncbi:MULTISPECIES: SDR family NAD(P)-dependent oxidoreductase [Streptomyces]|uniref:SDR family NAD(P)-dependent oxidoreductase n=1 Tax=Streptomyces TaxID=1883 RepID=UPI00099D02F9|nr:MULTISPECIES: SDR family NAD(P)-dependent oxidoreductase [Streptomyces]
MVVVTGASSGIGRRVAHTLAARRADLVPAARTERTLAAVARERASSASSTGTGRTAACRVRVRSANRWPRGRGEPDGAATGAARIRTRLRE